MRFPRRKAETRSRGIAGKVVAGVFFFAVLCVAPVFENTIIGYVPVLSFLIVLALACAYPRVLARSLEFDLIVNKAECLRDTDVNLLARFNNPMPLVCPRIDVVFYVADIFGQDDTVSTFSFSLGPRSTRDFPFGVRFAHIGTVRAGVKSVTLHDPFGVFRKTIQVEEGRAIDVLTRTVQLDSGIFKTLQLQETMEAATPFNKDGVEYTGVRDYVFGDPIKSIHWKLSAHSDGQLYTRLFDSVGEPVVHVFCNTCFGDRDNQTVMALYDAEVEAALSVFDYGIETGLRMTLSFPDEAGVRVNYSNSDRVSHHDFVQRFPLPGKAPNSNAFTRIVMDASANMRDNGNFVICTALLDEPLVDALSMIGQGRKRALLLFFLPSGITQKERSELMRPVRRLEQSNVVCCALSTAEELKGVSL